MSKYPAACAFHPLTRVVEAIEHERVVSYAVQLTDLLREWRDCSRINYADFYNRVNVALANNPMPGSSNGRTPTNPVGNAGSTPAPRSTDCVHETGKQVERFTPSNIDGTMESDADGCWVSFEDYDELRHQSGHQSNVSIDKTKRAYVALLKALETMVGGTPEFGKVSGAAALLYEAYEGWFYAERDNGHQVSQHTLFAWWDHFNGEFVTEPEDANRREARGNKLTPLFTVDSQFVACNERPETPKSPCDCGEGQCAWPVREGQFCKRGYLREEAR